MSSITNTRTHTGRSISYVSSQDFIQPITSKQQTTEAWVTVPVPDAKGKVQFRPRGYSIASRLSDQSVPWEINGKYVMACRSGPTECPDHIQAKHEGFYHQGSSFASPFSLYYFDETAPNNKLLANDLRVHFTGVDDARTPTIKAKNSKAKCGNKSAMEYELRKLYFDIDDLRVPPKGTGLKMLPSHSVSYRNYPAVCYDVVAPTHYQDFFRARKAPGLFA